MKGGSGVGGESEHEEPLIMGEAVGWTGDVVWSVEGDADGGAGCKGEGGRVKTGVRGRSRWVALSLRRLRVSHRRLRSSLRA